MEMKVTGEDEVRKNIESQLKRMGSKARGWLVRWCVKVTAEARRKLTWREEGEGGGRFTARLSRSITHVIGESPKEITAKVGTDVKYARYVEGWPKTPKRHFVPFSKAPDLYRWAVRHGVEVGDRFKGGLQVGGVAFPFLRPTIEDLYPAMVRDIVKALRV